MKAERAVYFSMVCRVDCIRDGGSQVSPLETVQTVRVMLLDDGGCTRKHLRTNVLLSFQA
ncbi:hypothetical protein RBSWK_03192 [Rhodopirellula baltica SWK14]|uniref:Uncharacterized protein n=1 Tax=Rhodopirellula baltica SWK14 TaxID=993516 RepID=L7CGX9_RHOBT|nr:hypothetical protein RBSWK_03192 [Rhodopirellula baltica SWK14]